MGIRGRATTLAWTGFAATLVLALAVSAYSANEPPAPAVPFSMGPVEYLGSFSTPADVKGRPSGFRRFINKTLGLEDDHRRMVFPHGVAVDANGRVLVADTRGQVVHVFDSAGRKYKQLHAPESDPFLSPIAIALDSQGRIYVTDSGRSRIFVFRPDGKFLRTLGALSKNESIFKRCTGLAIDRQRDILYVVDTVAMRVVALNTEGKVLGRFGQPGTGPAEFNYPTHISVAADGTLWVVDSLNFRVQHLDPSGQILAVFGGQGDRPGEFDKPKGIAIDGQGRIFVVEGRFDRVQAYDPEGQMLFTFGNTGAAPGEFFLPAGIALDQDGKIYVADGQNGRVEIFRVKAESQGAR
jgi:DNA-binding beta-propeller fold protein YncE